jgi:hypothetical protein
VGERGRAHGRNLKSIEKLFGKHEVNSEDMHIDGMMMIMMIIIII